LDANGSGALRLTPASNSWSSYLLYNNPQNTRDGIDVNFQQAQYGGNDADGISFFIKNGANTNTVPGAAGAGLGYAKVTGYGDGIPGGLIGVGLDRYGNFSDPGYVGSGPGARPNAVVVRGPDTSAAKDGSAGFTYLTGVTLSGGNTFSAGADTRAGRTRYVRVRVDPAYFDSPKVYVWVSSTPVPTARDATTLATATLSTSAPAEYLSSSTFKFGFAGSTGGQNNIHEIWGLTVASAEPPLFNVSYRAIADPNALSGKWDAWSGVPIGNPVGTVPTDSNKYLQGATLVMPTPALYVQDHRFVGWSDGTTTYPPGSTYTFGASDVTFTGVWSYLGCFNELCAPKYGGPDGYKLKDDQASPSPSASVAAAVSGGGSSSGSGLVGDSLDPLIDAVARDLGAGQGRVFVGGVPVDVVVRGNASRSGVQVLSSDESWLVEVRGSDRSGGPAVLTGAGGLQSFAGQPLSVSGTGCVPGSEARVHVLNPTQTLGSVLVGADGAFAGSVLVPAGLAAGSYVVQVNCFSSSQVVRKASVGLQIAAGASARRQVKGSVFFPVLSPVVGDRAQATLQALVRKLPKGASGVVVTVKGFVQPTAASGNDKSLSRSRAGNVVAWLQQAGVKGRYTTAGVGKATQTGPEARRVEVTISYIPPS
jgi:outer membrane protein OmpA-like peptidoglycan-associated protein